MELILTILAIGILFGRNSDEESEYLNNWFFGLLLFDLMDEDEDMDEDLEDDDEA